MPQQTAARLTRCALGAVLCARAAAAQPPPLVLTHANVIDGVSARPLADATIVIRDGRIVSVSATRGPVPAGARVVDLGGGWVLPGLIDAHVHLRDLASARSALRAGVTTARSLGAPHFTDLGIRDLHRAGAADVPEVLGAGYHVRRR
ncbi:MAG TPA: hypothetical protein VD931_00270, partial [Baekduia sp.]|nr:hypothetical protein [Baekduia sp.]